jgi:hypothetical protein
MKRIEKMPHRAGHGYKKQESDGRYIPTRLSFGPRGFLFTTAEAPLIGNCLLHALKKQQDSFTGDKAARA